MPLAVPRYTIADLAAFPDDRYRYELVGGTLLVTPAPAPYHDLVVLRLQNALEQYLGARARVHVRAAVEVAPDTHLEPDLLVIPTEEPVGGIGPDTRWSDVHSWWLAVEVSGPGARVYDRDAKIPSYLVIGVAEVWRVDLQEHLVEVARPGTPLQRELARLVWQAPDRGTPLVIPVAELFAPER